MRQFIKTRDDAEEIPADLIDGYLLHSHLDDGAFGRVFLATQLKFPRTVVIKTPHDLGGLSVSEFLTELNKTTKLNHPGIVTVYDTGTFSYPGSEDATRPYFSMEYLQGQTVHERFKKVRKSLNLTQNLNLFLGLCDAILYAHLNGVYHCDLHGHNILLMPVGTGYAVKIIDFGLPMQETPANVKEREQADFIALTNLLLQYFFFPNVNKLAKQAVESAADIAGLRDNVRSIIDSRFNDRFVFDDDGRVGASEIEAREERLGRVALMFVKDKAIAKDLTIRVQPWLGADLAWEDKGRFYDIAFWPSTSTDAYGSFLLLLSLSQLHFTHTERRVWNFADTDSVTDQEAGDYFTDFLTAMEVLICTNMLMESGFMHAEVKRGLEDFFHRDAVTTYRGGTHAKLLVYQGLLMQFGRAGVIREIPEGRSEENLVLRKLWGYSYLLSKLDSLTYPDVKVLRDYLQTFLDCFYEGDLHLAVVNPEGKLTLIKVDVLLKPSGVAVGGDGESPLLIFNGGAQSADADYTVALDLESLTDLYACLLVEVRYRLPVSQRYVSGGVSVVARRGLGIIIESGLRAFHVKEDNDGSSIFDALVSEVERYLQQKRLQPEVLQRKIDALINDQKRNLNGLIISERDFEDRDFKMEYIEVVAIIKAVTYEPKRDQCARLITRLDAARTDLATYIQERFQ